MPKLVKDYASVAPLTAGGTRQAAGSSIGPTITLPKPPSYGLTGTASGGGTTTRTVTPIQVYESQVDSNPGTVAAQGIFDANATNLANARAAAIQQAIIRAGWTPDMSSGALSGYASDVTQSALDQARANPMSQKAQLDLQLGQAKTNLPYDLAASGASRSGALGIELGNLGRSYDTASYQGMQDLLASITGSVNDYASGYNTAQSNLQAARRDIANRLAQQAGYSESISTTGDEWLPSTSGNPTDLSPSYPAPAINAVVQKAIAKLGAKPGGKAPANIYQTIKQTTMGG